jgi:two-component system chemotaxis sensor kinase CheA
MSEAERILETFREEAAEVADELTQIVGVLRRAGDAAEWSEAVSSARRLAHNLKGAAASVGNEEVETLCHELEDVLAALDREGFDAEGAELLERLIATIERQSSQTQEPAAPVAQSEATLRIPAARLDQLIRQVGDLLTTHARMVDRVARLRELSSELNELVSRPEGQKASLEVLAANLAALVQRDQRELLDFGYLTQEVSESVRQARMVPLSAEAPGWRRLARDTAAAVGKKIDLAIRVGNLEIDKSLLEGLRDPLFHLIRNAIDHGIETPGERQQRGKPGAGRVEIRAEMRGPRMLLELSDDGRGLDPAAISAAATEKGLIDGSQSERMSEADVLALLFEPGFSTAASVSRVSGRGVGLDVVRRQVIALGGEIQLPGRPRLGGATFELLLPITVLSTRQLLVRAGEGLYALSMECVQRIVSVDRSAVTSVDGNPIVVLEGATPLRLFRLTGLLDERAAETSERLKVLVAGSGGREIGLEVQDVLGEGDHLTRPLPWNVEEVAGVGGAVVLADGSIALVLDVGDLIDGAQAAPEKGPVPKPEPATRLPRILVVDDSLSSRTLARNMLAAAGYQVSVCQDGTSAWDALQHGSFDLLVSDIKMPGIDGLELTRKVRRHERLATLPVVLVTSLGAPEQVAQGAEAGADEYLVKGQFDQSGLLEAVGRHI